MRFRKPIVTLALLFALAGAAHAGDDPYILPVTFNGSAWVRLENITDDTNAVRLYKVCLLRGIYEGAYAMDPENALQQYGPWISFGELSEILDRFYADERNMKIPLTQALVLVARTSGGRAPLSSHSAGDRSGVMVSMER